MEGVCVSDIPNILDALAGNVSIGTSASSYGLIWEKERERDMIYHYQWMNYAFNTWTSVTMLPSNSSTPKISIHVICMCHIILSPVWTYIVVHYNSTCTIVICACTVYTHTVLTYHLLYCLYFCDLPGHPEP